ATLTIAFTCFNCGETGHRQSACPKRVLFGDDEIVFDPEVEDQQHTETEERVTGDADNLLVTRRSFLTPQIEESWLQSNIFRSTYTIRGKVCRLIVDSRSCTNAISEEAVGKLVLFTEPHPTPYRLALLNSKQISEFLDAAVFFFQLALVTRSWFVAMWFPWTLYNRRTVHDGFTNTYTFSFEGKRITLLSSQEMMVPKTPDQHIVSSPDTKQLPPPVFFVNRSQFLEDCAESAGGMVLILKPSSPPTSSTIPTEFQDLVREFQDVFPEELPSGLPPLRETLH
ncbi:hypothetical protein EUTSA_v10017580mg, partial [Eutrema salsugineum]